MQSYNFKASRRVSKHALVVLSIVIAALVSFGVLPTDAAYATYRQEPSSAPPRRGGRSGRSSRGLQSGGRGNDDAPSGSSERGGGRSSAPKSVPQTPWSQYMLKFDLTRSHGAGIYIDLGGYESIGNKSYRMPIGKCPVMGKIIELSSGADFLEPISAASAKERGIAFPETAVTSSESEGGALKRAGADESLSPVAASDLRRWGYTGNAVANCAEYASNIVPGSDPSTKYRYPFVYDSKYEMCYILYSPMQYNQGKRYCDNDGAASEGRSSLLCMKPHKSDIDAHLYYGSARVDPKWEENCPMSPVRDAIFGRWVGGSCVAIEPAFEEFVNSAEECSALLFENSAADIEIDSEQERFDELSKLYEGLSRMKVSQVAEALFSPIAKSSASARLSKGMGLNWANYDLETGSCRVLSETPNCLIINAGSLALNALASPLEQDAVNFPCHIDTNGYVNPRPRGASKMRDSDFEVTTALNMKTIKCSKYVHSKHSESCGTYYYCSEEKNDYVNRFLQFWRMKSVRWFMVSSAVLVVLSALGYWLYNRLWRARPRRDAEDYDRLMSKYEYDDESSSKREPEQQLKSDAYIWGEAAARPSEVTPVHLTKIN
ncbi:apical membrane antigen 1 [Babesia caballi]|uniref:Apical membrane antigen 1 n=1 Tax=Babesia caballi TaxID=5871 RepID=A0AAV4LQQ4_BABCB|nr:apical membrane antigen 1 [Babesia caballi]